MWYNEWFGVWFEDYFGALTDTPTTPSVTVEYVLNIPREEIKRKIIRKFIEEGINRL